MHDPLCVAFEVKLPIPRVYLSRKHFAEGRAPSFDTGIRRRRRTNDENLGQPIYPWWRAKGYEVFAFGAQWRWTSFLTIWHSEPGGRDSGDVCPHRIKWEDHTGKVHYRRSTAWRWHVHHWHIQWHQGPAVAQEAAHALRVVRRTLPQARLRQLLDAVGRTSREVVEGRARPVPPRLLRHRSRAPDVHLRRAGHRDPRVDAQDAR